MFSYEFEGTMYQADTIKELQEILEEAGFKGNIAAMFVDIANQILEEEAEAANQSLDYENDEASIDEAINEDLAQQDEDVQEALNNLETVYFFPEDKTKN